MKDQKLTITNTLKLGFLSFFGTGYAPFAPGTVGSLATIPLILLLSYLKVSFSFLIIFTICLFIIACYITDIVQKERDLHDPGWIVIDEVVGMLVTWAFIFPKVDIYSLFIVFITFRVFDIVKIFPANWADKKIDNGIGTNLDDFISGIYAGITSLLIDYSLHTYIFSK
jgi:phosphatidylglycerophosphatase A